MSHETETQMNKKEKKQMYALVPQLVNNLLLSRGEICLAYFIPPANGAVG